MCDESRYNSSSFSEAHFIESSNSNRQSNIYEEAVAIRNIPSNESVASRRDEFEPIRQNRLGLPSKDVSDSTRSLLKSLFIALLILIVFSVLSTSLTVWCVIRMQEDTELVLTRLRSMEKFQSFSPVHDALRNRSAAAVNGDDSFGQNQAKLDILHTMLLKITKYLESISQSQHKREGTQHNATFVTNYEEQHESTLQNMSLAVAILKDYMIRSQREQTKEWKNMAVRCLRIENTLMQIRVNLSTTLQGMSLRTGVIENGLSNYIPKLNENWRNVSHGLTDSISLQQNQATALENMSDMIKRMERVQGRLSTSSEIASMRSSFLTDHQTKYQRLERATSSLSSTLNSVVAGVSNSEKKHEAIQKSVQAIKPSRSAIRLVNGTNSYSGRVEVLYHGEWGTVCDDNWDTNDASVICRMMGFSRAASAPTDARYGKGIGEIVLDDVQCKGGEDSVWNCKKSSWGEHNCGHHEDASVICVP